MEIRIERKGSLPPYLSFCLTHSIFQHTYATHYLTRVDPCEEYVRLVCPQSNILKCHAIQYGDLTIPNRERCLEVPNHEGTCNIVVVLALTGREEHTVRDFSPGVNACITS